MLSSKCCVAAATDWQRVVSDVVLVAGTSRSWFLGRDPVISQQEFEARWCRNSVVARVRAAGGQRDNVPSVRVRAGGTSGGWGLQSGRQRWGGRRRRRQRQWRWRAAGAAGRRGRRSRPDRWDADAPTPSRSPSPRLSHLHVTLFMRLTPLVCCICSLVWRWKRLEGGSNATCAAAATGAAAPHAAAAAALAPTDGMPTRRRPHAHPHPDSHISMSLFLCVSLLWSAASAV
jgi:hypothetical protein